MTGSILDRLALLLFTVLLTRKFNDIGHTGLLLDSDTEPVS
nr:hypothetical protein [Salmonella enterica subsp. enterica serovar Rissen]WCS70386.1 hypothetical protein [Salmonella enterica subsp. enterica serovar Rissen]